MENLLIDEIKCVVKNSYYLTGSFVKGDGVGHAEPTEINLDIKSLKRTLFLMKISFYICYIK